MARAQHAERGRIVDTEVPGTLALVIDQRRTPAEVSRRFAQAITSGDLDGALACWSPAAVIVTPDGSEIRGHAALTERFRRLIAVGAQLKISVSHEVYTERGATAVTQMTISVPTESEMTTAKTVGAVTYAPGIGGLQILVDRLGPHDR
jgi:ketosteroid isomerase-like protein